jgi:redox-sensitive bicupin YhaK (pirin superfamily)
MKTILHKADTRGHANYGWLDTFYSFSFANYYDPQRIHFGKLRVLNDDTVAAGMGFGTHPHDNMEIITLVMEGALEHKDSMGNTGVINANEIQVMSAGTGITHSEYNHSKDKPLKLFQIWVYPNKRNVDPRYDQIRLDPADRKNKLQQVVSPHPGKEGVWIYQEAAFFLGRFDKDLDVSFSLQKKNNGIYVFIIEGKADVEGQVLERRDGYGISETDALKIHTKQDTEILIMEVPMG